MKRFALLLIFTSQIAFAGPSYGKAAMEVQVLNKLLDNVRPQSYPGRLMGVMVPSRTDLSARQISAFGYELLQKPRFTTILFLYTSQPQLQSEEDWDPDQEFIFESMDIREGAIMPTTDEIETALGPIPVDQMLRTRILFSSTHFWLENFSHEKSETVQSHMTYIKHVTEDKSITVLPIGISVTDPDTSKDIATDILQAIDELDLQDDILVMMASDLSSGLTRQRANYLDSQLLTLIEGLSGEALLTLQENMILEEARLHLFPDRFAMLTGIYVLNQLFSTGGHTLIYGNTGQFTISKEIKAVEGMASVVFSSGKPYKVKLSKNRTGRLKKELPQEYLREILEQGRLAAGHALNPETQPPQPLEEREDIQRSWTDMLNFMKTSQWPVFVTIYKDGRVRGQSGSLKSEGPLDEVTKYHAVQAALHDPQRPPMTYEELQESTIGLAIPIAPKKISTEKKIVQNRDGVFLQYKYRKSTFLPDAWKRFPHRIVLLSELAAQAGLDPWRWKAHGAQLKVFQALMTSEGR